MVSGDACSGKQHNPSQACTAQLKGLGEWGREREREKESERPREREREREREMERKLAQMKLTARC